MANVSWKEKQDLQPIIVGFSLLTRISTMPGSPTFTIAQPLINTRLHLATWVLLGSQVLILLAKNVFGLEKIPVLDIAQNQILQIPIEELHNLIQYLGSRRVNTTSNQVPSSQIIPGSSTTANFPTELPPDSPVYIALFITSDYSNELYTPSILTYLPIVSFPGLRGALPFLILALLAVIFIRCVVPPETTGAKPIQKQSIGQNHSYKLTSEDLIVILKRFGKYFITP